MKLYVYKNHLLFITPVSVNLQNVSLTTDANAIKRMQKSAEGP